MRTKQEVIDFLESKVGTKVKCVGNSSLDGQCVTLIKVLMEFLGVPEPYKARGNANSCISKYLSEGIAKPGMGFISVFSNKDMAKGVGHIWCNAGEGTGTFYESNGSKPLIVTKGKTYTYDNVCNFDSYIKEDTMADTAEVTKLKGDLEQALRDKASLESQVAGWVRDTTNGKYILASDVKPPANDVDLTKWEINGMVISTTDGNKTTSLNYKLK